LEQFKLNNKVYRLNDIINLDLENGQYSDFEAKTLSIIQDWFHLKNTFSFQTSGSTGKPKNIEFSRGQIIDSARRTIKTFGLASGQTILCCLNTQFVAGFMMLIRAFESGMKLIIVEPNSDPLSLIDDEMIEFVAMTPIQVQGSLEHHAEKFNQIKTLLIGGAGLHRELEEKLIRTKCKVFHTYAMTETLTHIAIRSINQKQKKYYALEGVTFGKAEDGCLIIDDQVLNIHALKTNDIVELENEKEFHWIGRSDGVVNSGGIKIQIDDLELRIKDLLSEYGNYNEICLVSVPDLQLTNKLVLLLEEGKTNIGPGDFLAILKSALPAYHAPREIRMVPRLFYTNTGKIDRLKNVNAYL
jgi:O-succinylbenzoic acid--CoA ligase